MPFADLADVRLFYTDDRGDPDHAAPPLLLVHGWGGDSHGWCLHLPALSRHRVIAVDLRGHGRSSVPERGYGPHDMAVDLAGLLDHVDCGPVVAVGHSMGAQVVTALAVRYPSRVRALVAVDPAYGAAGDEVEQIPQRLADLRGDGAEAAVRQMAGAFTAATPAWLKTWRIRQMLGAPASVLAQAYAGMYLEPDAFGVRPASEVYLAKVSCPTLSLFSSPEPAAWAAQQRHHPLSTVVSWQGAGHYLHEERPEQFVALVGEWLDAISVD